MTNSSVELVTEEVKQCVVKLLQEMKIRNYSIDISEGTKRGDNYLGIIATVQIEGEDVNNKNVTLNWIIKSAPRTEAFRDFCPVRALYGRECYMYNVVFPEFERLQNEAKVLNSFKSLAKCHKTTMADANEALIMENMKKLGFKLKDRHHPLDYEHVRLVLREYGRFHALSFALRDRKPEVFDTIAENTPDAFFSQVNPEEMKKASDMQIGRGLDSLDPEKDKIYYEKFSNFKDNHFEIMLEAGKPDLAGKCAIITHSDCWQNNMLFKYEDSSRPNTPTNLCLLDWQLAHYASPAIDLSYFMFTCTNKKLRDEHYDDLMLEYHNSLSLFLKEFGCNPDVLFPYETFLQHLKQYSVYGLGMACMVLYLMTSETDEIPDFHNVTKDNMNEFVNFTSKNSNLYLERIRGVIIDFVDKQYLFKVVGEFIANERQHNNPEEIEPMEM